MAQDAVLVETQRGMEVEVYADKDDVTLWVGHGGMAGEMARLTAQEARQIGELLIKVADAQEACS